MSNRKVRYICPICGDDGTERVFRGVRQICVTPREGRKLQAALEVARNQERKDPGRKYA